MRSLAVVLAMTLISRQTVTAAPEAAVRGTDAGSGVTFVLLPVAGRRATPAIGGTTPRLAAQCTKDSAGKLHFELLADLGESGELHFVPPWKQTKESPYPPVLPQAAVAMEFLGYTKVKPMKREWEEIAGWSGEWRYSTPGFRSRNMEDVRFFLQYLKALPTLRLTLPSNDGAKVPVVIEFETPKWQAAVKAEPMCAASGL